MLLRFLALVFLSSVLPAACFAQISTINVDLQGGGNAVGALGLAAHSDLNGVAALWNIGDSSGQTGLFDSGGTVTDVDFSITNANGQFSQPGSGQQALLRDFVFSNTLPEADRSLTLDISGLNSTSTYDLFVYGGTQFNVNADASLDVAVNGGTPNRIDWTGLDGNPLLTSSFILGENYTVFTGLSGVSDLSVVTTNIAVSPGVYGEPNLSGFALVEVSAVPEPGSVAFAVCLLGAFVARRRRIS